MPRPTVSPGTETAEREDVSPLYRVVLLDDNDHTYDYVIEMLQAIFIFSVDQAYQQRLYLWAVREGLTQALKREIQ